LCLPAKSQDRSDYTLKGTLVNQVSRALRRTDRPVIAC
jgi:hypothetical protein